MALVTQHDAEKMVLNSHLRKTDTLSDFMRLYLFILQLAFEHGLISSSTRNSIASFIMEAVEKAAKGSIILIFNYVYVISMRFTSLTNYECWELMKNITSVDEASKFISSIHDWFSKRIETDLETLNRESNKITFLNSPFLITVWKNCLESLKSVGGCLEQETNFDLKSNHNLSSSTLFYEILVHEEGLTYLDRLEDYIKKFFIEVSILVKLNGSNVMKAIVDERRVLINEEPSEEVIKAQQKYDEAVEKYLSLEKKYLKKIKLARIGKRNYERFVAAFTKTHQDMPEDEFEEALDEEWGNSPDYCSLDLEDVQNEFVDFKIKQKKILSNLKDEIDYAKNVSTGLKNTMMDMSENVTLSDVLKEYALINLAKKGTIIYPSDPSEKDTMVNMIPIETAVEIFLQSAICKTILSAQEQAYLKS